MDERGYPLREEATQLATPPPPDRSGPVDEEVFEEPPPPRRRRPVLVTSPWPILLAALLLLGGLAVAYALTRPGDSTRAGNGPEPAAAAAAPAAAPPAPEPSTPSATSPSPQPPAQPPPPAPAAHKSSTARLAVPSLTGTPLPRAVSTLRRAGLVAVVSHVPSNGPAGRVLSQRPAAGMKLARGSRVTLGVSVQRTIAVPDVTGVQGLAAVHTLKRNHLVASVRYVPSTQPARRVVSQWPQAGNSVKQGTSVRLNVSQGIRPAPDRTTVPDVTGEDEQTATSDLRAAGFTVRSTDAATTDPEEDGTVIRESPSPGRQVPKSSIVTVYVGRT
jgi:hypothetical protein